MVRGRQGGVRPLWQQAPPLLLPPPPPSGLTQVFYTAASKIVRPKLEQLQVAEGQFNVAMAALADAESRLAVVEAKVRELKATFDRQIAEKRRIEDGAHQLKRKMEQAANLIKALDGEVRAVGACRGCLCSVSTRSPAPIPAA